MNEKKGKSTFRNFSVSNLTAILFRLFTLCAFVCCFTLVAGKSNVSSLSGADKTIFVVSTSEISSASSAYSSQSLQVNASFQNVNSTNTTSPTLLQNKTGILTILQSSNFPITGSTEPITLAMSFVTTTEVPSVPRSVRSLLDASSFSIVGFTEPLTLALFTSESLSNQSIESSLSSSNSVITSSYSSNASSLKGTNFSRSLHVTQSTLQNNATSSSLSMKKILPTSGQMSSSSLGKPRTDTPSTETKNLSRINIFQSIASTESGLSIKESTSLEVNGYSSATQSATQAAHSSVQSSTSNIIQLKTLQVSAGNGTSSTASQIAKSLRMSNSVTTPSSSSLLSMSSYLPASPIGYLTASLSVSVTRQFSKIASFATLSKFGEFFNNNSSLGASGVKTPSLVPTPFVTSILLDTVANSASPVTAAAVSISSTSSSFNHVHNVSSVATPSLSGSLVHKSEVTVSSPVVPLNFTDSMVGTSLRFNRTTFMPTFSTTQKRTDTPVNSSYVSLTKPDVSKSNSLEPLSTPNSSEFLISSLPYSGHVLVSTSVGQSSEKSVQVSLETSANYESSREGVNATSVSRHSSRSLSVAYFSSFSTLYFSKDGSSKVHRENLTTSNVHISPLSSFPLGVTETRMLTSLFTSAGFSRTNTSALMISTVSTQKVQTSTGSFLLQTSVATSKSKLHPNSSIKNSFDALNTTKHVDSTFMVLVTTTVSTSSNISYVKQHFTPISSASHLLTGKSYFLPNTRPLVDISPSFEYNSGTPMTVFSTSISLNVTPNATTEQSRNSLSTDVTSFLLYQSSITQNVTMSPNVTVMETFSTYESEIGRSVVPTSLSLKSSIFVIEPSVSVKRVNMSTLHSVLRSLKVSRNATPSLSTGTGFLQFKTSISRPLNTTTPRITSSGDSYVNTLSSSGRNESADRSVVTKTETFVSGFPVTSHGKSSPFSPFQTTTVPVSSKLTSPTPFSQLHPSASDVSAVSLSYSTLTTPRINTSGDGGLSVPATFLSSIRTPATEPFANRSSTSSLQAHSSKLFPLVTTTFVSAVDATSSSAFSTSVAIFLRFGISVPRNQSVNDPDFKPSLEEGIRLAYQNGSVNSSSGNVSIIIHSIERSPDSNSSNVNVTFQVLIGSEPLNANLVVTTIEQANFSLGYFVGYEVVESLHAVFISLPSSSPTMSMNSSVSASVQRTIVTSHARRTLTSHYSYTLQPRSSTTRVANKTAASESLPPSQVLTAVESSVSVSSTPLSQMSLPSNTSLAIVSYLTSVSSDRSLKSGVYFTSLVTTATRSSMSTSLKTVNVTHFRSISSASSAIISFDHSEGSIVVRGTGIASLSLTKAFSAMPTILLTTLTLPSKSQQPSIIRSLTSTQQSRPLSTKSESLTSSKQTSLSSEVMTSRSEMSSSSPSPSSLTLTSTLPSSFLTTYVTRAHTKVSSSEEKKSSTVVTFNSTITATMGDSSVRHATSSIIEPTPTGSIVKSFTFTLPAMSSFLKSLTTYFTSSVMLGVTSFTVFPSSILKSETVLIQNSTARMMSLSKEGVPLTQTLRIPGSFSKTKVTSSLQSASTAITKQSLQLLPTSHILGRTISLIASSRFFNGSSVSVVAYSTKTHRTVETMSVLTLNSSVTSAKSSTFASAPSVQMPSSFNATSPISTIFDVSFITASSEVLLSSAMSSTFSLTGSTNSTLSDSSIVVSSSSPAFYGSYTTSSSRLSLAFSNTLTLSRFQASAYATLTLIGMSRKINSTRSTSFDETSLHSSTVRVSVSKTSFSVSRSPHKTSSSGVALPVSSISRSPFYPSSSVSTSGYTTLFANRSQTTSSMTSEITSSRYLSRSSVLASRQTSRSGSGLSLTLLYMPSSIWSNDTIHATSLSMVSKRSSPSSFTVQVYASTSGPLSSKSSVTFSAVSDKLSTRTSLESETRFSGSVTTKGTHTSILATNRTVEANITISSAKVSSLSILNISSLLPTALTLSAFQASGNATLSLIVMSMTINSTRSAFFNDTTVRSSTSRVNVSKTPFSASTSPHESLSSNVALQMSSDLRLPFTPSSAVITLSAKVSILSVSNNSSSLYTAEVTQVATREAATANLSSTQYPTTRVTDFVSERSLSSQSVQPSTPSSQKDSSQKTFVTATTGNLANNASTRATMHSLMQTTAPLSSLRSSSPAQLSSDGLATSFSLIRSHFPTPEVSGSKTSENVVGITSLPASRSLQIPPASGVSVFYDSLGSTVLTPVSIPSTSNISYVLDKSSTSLSSTTSVTEAISSRFISPAFSTELSQIARTFANTLQSFPTSLHMGTASAKSGSIVHPAATGSSIPIFTPKTSSIVVSFTHSDILVSPSAITVSSVEVNSSSIKSVTLGTDALLSPQSTTFAESTLVVTSTPVGLSRRSKLRTGSVDISKSSMLTLSSSLTSVVTIDFSSVVDSSSVPVTLRTSKESSPVTSVKQLTSSDRSSYSMHARPSSSPLLLSSARLASTKATAELPVTTLRGSKITITRTSGVVVRETSQASFVTKTVPLSSISVPLRITKDVTTATSLEKSYSVSRTSSSAAATVDPTEPVRPTVGANNTEGLVGLQILVPKTEDEMNSTFRENIELRLAAAYRKGQEKATARKKRDLEFFDDWDVRSFDSWKRSAAFKVYEKQSRRHRRQIDSIIALVEAIRRAKPIVGDELVDIEYRIFNGPNMLSAETVVETMNRLTEGEMVSTLKYAVTLRPYVVKDITVTPTPTASSSKWSILIPAIIVPIVVVLFLILAFTWAKCAAKRKRERLKVKPHDKGPTYKNLEIKVLPSHEVTPAPLGLAKKKRPSISSTSSSDIPPKCPTLPVPDYSPGKTDSPEKPNQRYRRRTDGKGIDHKTNNNRHSTKDIIHTNGHVKHEHHVQNPKDTGDYIEMKHLAGIVENRPQMRDEKLANSLTRQEPPLRFTPLPPLIQTPLVGPTPPIPDTMTAKENKEYDRIIAESGVPPAWLSKMKMIALQNVAASQEAELNEDEDILSLKANVERWRNKMRHREKLRQDIREKERERERKLKKYEKEEKEEKKGKEKDTVEDYNAILQRSLTAERKRRSRIERWRKNRVGTSSSKSSGSSSSSSSSSDSDSDEKHKHAKEEGKTKKKKRQEKEKKVKEQAPPLITGQSAQETKRETAWTIKETPGVRLVSVKPRIEQSQYLKRETTTEPAYVQNDVQTYDVPSPRPVSSRSQQKDRVHQLLETGYPVLPIMPTHLVRPPTSEYIVDEHPYEDMEDLDPYAVHYDNEDQFIGDGVPIVPIQAFSGPPVYEDEHIYEEPIIAPASLPQTRFVTPREYKPGVLIPTQYARGYIGRPPGTRGRPTSASQHPGVARPARLSRPTSAKTEPIARYVVPPGGSSLPTRGVPPPSVPGSRYMLANRPTVATAPQPSIGTSPRYMVDPEIPKEQPPSSFDGARVILSRAQANVDRFEQDSRVNAPDETDAASVSEQLYARPQKKIPLQTLTSRKEPSRFDVAAREHAELEAQLLVSRALARARSNVRT